MAEQLFERMPRSRLYEDIVSSIEDLIICGRLKPGERLPSERELAQTMQVGRGAVRESVKLLAERGLVEILPGRGTFVSRPQGNTLSAQIDRLVRTGTGTYGDLNEVRQVLEVAIAGLAAERAGAEDLMNLKKAAGDMDRAIQSPEEYVTAHLAFHGALARATGNSVFPLLIDALVDLLRQRTFEMFNETGALENRQFWHRRLYEAVVRRDSVAARAAMEHHLVHANKDGAAREPE